jgi:tRNA(Ile)-lysidine synthase
MVVAVSGGADSVALLHALAWLRTPLALRLHVAHVDHQLRPGSGEDASRVRALAQNLGLPCTVVRVDVLRRRGGRRLSPEEAARDARYDALAQVSANVGASAVALGHTADDQAETVLLHLARGSGLSGLRGMETLTTRACGDLPDMTLVRPLLAVRRSQTQEHCRSHGLTVSWDETNLDARVPRNLIRMEALPVLARINPRVVEALGRLARSAGRDLDYVEGQVMERWPSVAEPVTGGLRLDRAALLALDPSLQRHMLRAAYAQVRGSGAGLAEALLESTLRLAGGPAGRSISLPGGVRAEAGYGGISLLREGSAACARSPLLGERPLAMPGETMVGGWSIMAGVEPTPSVLDAGPYVAFLSADAMAGPIAVRGWRNGDRFQPLGLGGHEKKLQDFFVAAHVPRADRRRTPLVVTPAGIAWVAGWRIAHWARVTPRTRQVVRLELREEASP